MCQYLSVRVSNSVRGSRRRKWFWYCLIIACGRVFRAIAGSFSGDDFQKIADDLLITCLSRAALRNHAVLYCRVKERGGRYETWQGARPDLPANAKLIEHHRLYLLGLVLSVDDNTLLEEITDLFYTAYGITLTVPETCRGRCSR